MRRATTAVLLALVLVTTIPGGAEAGPGRAVDPLDAWIEKLIAHCESAIPEKGARIVVFPLLQSRRTGIRTSRLGELTAARIADRLGERLGDRGEVIHDLDLMRELEDQNRAGRDYANALDAADLGMRCLADYVIAGTLDIVKDDFLNHFLVKAHGIPVDGGRSFRDEFYVRCDGRRPDLPESRLWKLMEHWRRQDPEWELGDRADPVPPDPANELRVALRYVAWKLVRKHRDVITDRRVVVRPAPLPSCAHQHRYLDNLYFQLQEEHDALAARAFETGADLGRLQNEVPVEVDDRKYSSWTDARKAIDRFETAAFRLSEAGRLESRLGDDLASFLLESELLGPGQVGTPRDILEVLMRSHRGGRPGAAEEPEGHALLLLPAIELTGLTVGARVTLFDREVGAVATRSLRIRGKIGKAVARRLIQMERGRSPVDLDGEALDADRAPSVARRIERPGPRPLHLLVTEAEHRTTDLAEALAGSDLVRGGQTLREDASGLAEIRYDAGDSRARSEAQAIAARLRNGQIEIEPGAGDALRSFEYRLVPVGGDPILLATGKNAPDGTLPIHLVLVHAADATANPVQETPADDPRVDLGRVRMVVAWLGSGVDQIGRALLTAPAFADVGTRSGAKLGSANDIQPPRVNRCEIRYRADDPAAARAAAEIERRLRENPGDLGIHGSLIGRLEAMSPTSRGVPADPVAMVLGHGAPRGMVSILVVLVR